MKNTILESFENSKFEAFYEGISKSKVLKTLKVGRLLKRVGPKGHQYLLYSELPIDGIGMMSKSSIQNIDFGLRGYSIPYIILTALPIHLRELKVSHAN